jgi:hypothetical protein
MQVAKERRLKRMSNTLQGEVIAGGEADDAFMAVWLLTKAPFTDKK